MTSLLRIASFIVAPALVILSSDAARAETLAPSGQAYPDRIVNGHDVGFSTRPENLTPLGVSYADCAADTTLRFFVVLSGFVGSSSVQVWGSLDSDCTSPTDRGIGSTSARCWGLRSGNLVDPITQTPTMFSFDVRVQDLVGWQAAPPSGPQAARPPAKGIEACSAQPTFAAVPMYINFLAIDASGNPAGTPYQYRIPTDLVGPPAPGGVALTVLGADQLQAAWLANTDTDTIGYDVFLAAAPQTTCATSPLGLLASGGDAGPSGSLAQYLVAPSDGSGVTVADARTTTYGVGPAGSDQASAVVAAVDGFGNVGPTSSLACEEVGAASSGGGGSGGHGCSAGAATPAGRGVLEGAALFAMVAVARRRLKRRARLV